MNLPILVMISIIWGSNFFAQPCWSQVESNWKEKAENMVKTQLERRGIKDPRVLKVMRDTPRHLFVPQVYRQNAYEDGPLPIGHDQTISQPYIVALMTELLELTGEETVLEIGTGSGYQAAVLAQLVDTCFTIEILKPLAEEAGFLLKKLGYNNVVVKWGDGYEGWPQHAPFERIIVTAAPDKIPQALVDQLAVGGRMVLPLGNYYQELIVVTKNNLGIATKTIIPVRFVPMVHPKD